ncbi:MAG: aldose 1-epimerase [Acidobacteriaceae bacterium]
MNLEDPRVGRMYLEHVKEWFSALYHQVWRRNVMRSGWVTGFLLGCVLVGLTIGYREHMRGNFHKLKAEMADAREDAPVPRPGGQEAVSLIRTRLMGDSTPEFLSVTMLPGRGMNVLQITAYIPGKGEVNLMASPTVEGAAKAMTGKGEDADGRASLTMGSAFEAPWAGRIWGTPIEGGRVATSWQGQTITLPSAESGSASAVARDGLMLAEPSDSVRTSALPDGGDTEATFNAGDFGGRWPSKTQIAITVLLGGRSIDLTMTARNTGDEPEPIGLGWEPRFAILDGNRRQLRLRIPGEMRAEVRNRDKDVPTGVLLPVAGTAYDFTAHSGAKLGTMDLDECFVALEQNLLDNGPIAELSDPVSNYGLRLTALSPTIKAMRVVAPANADFVSIGPQFNYPDPFGREWEKQTDTGMVVLQPGQSTQWKVRLELFSLAGGEPPM